ncbi:MAG: permease prefix domain 2-containing transporter [bacterium]|nr:permease prefix domain 2-containing transporter [bacterium]
MKNPKPPIWAVKFLKAFIRNDLLDAVQGDLEELYNQKM